MSNLAKKFWAVPGLVVLFGLLAGCGEPKGAVSGKVSFNGEPVKNGSISFHMKNKGIAQDAKLDTGGKFTMASSLPTGTYQVYYVVPTAEPQDPSKKAAPPTAPTTIVPKRFHELQTSGLEVEVKAGRNDIPIELKK